jgi:hypothetical protein
MKVVGLDDIPSAGFLTPPLNTVAQEFDTTAASGLAQLVREIEARGQDEPMKAGRLPRLVIRRSTASPRHRSGERSTERHYGKTPDPFQPWEQKMSARSPPVILCSATRFSLATAVGGPPRHALLLAGNLGPRSSPRERRQKSVLRAYSSVVVRLPTPTSYSAFTTSAVAGRTRNERYKSYASSGRIQSIVPSRRARRVPYS